MVVHLQLVRLIAAALTTIHRFLRQYTLSDSTNNQRQLNHQRLGLLQLHHHLHLSMDRILLLLLLLLLPPPLRLLINLPLLLPFFLIMLEPLDLFLYGPPLREGLLSSRGSIKCRTPLWGLILFTMMAQSSLRPSSQMQASHHTAVAVHRQQR